MEMRAEASRQFFSQEKKKKKKKRTMAIYAVTSQNAANDISSLIEGGHWLIGFSPPPIFGLLSSPFYNGAGNLAALDCFKAMDSNSRSSSVTAFAVSSNGEN